MSHYNINIMKPEDEDLLSNALQLQATSIDFGHPSSASSFPDEYIAASDRNTYALPYSSTSEFVNSLGIYPHATHLTSGLHPPVAPMQNNGASDPGERRVNLRMNTHGFSHHEYSSPFNASPTLQGWTIANDPFMDTNSPSNMMNESPLSQGYSPLTPNTPLSAVEISPTRSSAPSPGLQGNHGVLRLAPSPVQASAYSMTLPNSPGEMQMSSPYCWQQQAAEHQLSVPQPLPQVQQRVSQHVGTSGSLNQSAAAVGRTVSQLMQGRPAQGRYPPPYSSPTSLHNRIALRNTVASGTPLFIRSEYTFMDWQLPGPLVPQAQYQPQTASDRRRYVEEVNFLPPILFETTDPPGIGISLADCTTHRFKRLKGADDELVTLFDECGPSISIRLNWEGYEPWTRQIPTRNFKVPQGPVSRKHLAKNVAKSVDRFLRDRAESPLVAGSDPSWQVGRGRIWFEDLVLLSLHQVSKGSWQANVCLNRPLEQVLNKFFDLP